LVYERKRHNPGKDHSPKKRKSWLHSILETVVSTRQYSETTKKITLFAAYFTTIEKTGMEERTATIGKRYTEIFITSFAAGESLRISELSI